MIFAPEGRKGCGIFCVVWIKKNPLTSAGYNGNIITEGHYREANGSPWFISYKESNLFLGSAVAFFHFMIFMVSDTKHYREDQPCDRCYSTERRQN